MSRRYRGLRSSLAFLVSGACWLRAGVGAWTATPNPGRGTRSSSAPDGAVYTDWGAQCRSRGARTTESAGSRSPGPGSVGAELLSDPRSRRRRPTGSDRRGLQRGSRKRELPVRSSPSAGMRVRAGRCSRAIPGTQFSDLRIDPSSAGYAVSPAAAFADTGGPGPPAFGRLQPAAPMAERTGRRSTRRSSEPPECTSVTAFALDSRTPGRLYAAAVVTKFEPLAPVFTPVFESSDRERRGPS